MRRILIAGVGYARFYEGSAYEGKA